MIRTVTKSYAQLAQENLDKQVRVDSLATLPVLSENPTPEDRYLAARKNMERFSIVGTWISLFAVTNFSKPLGWDFQKPDPSFYLPTNTNSPFWNVINTNGCGIPLKSFPSHLNLHLLNIVYSNSLSSDFFRGLVTFSSITPLGANETQILKDSYELQGWHPMPLPQFGSKGSLIGLTTLIRSLSAEPNSFPLILKLPSNEFLFLFVRNWGNSENPAPVPNFDFNSLLTNDQQEGITKRNPIRSYIRAFNENGLKVLSYLSVKTCCKQDGTIYYTPTELYSWENVRIDGITDKTRYNWVKLLLVCLKYSHIISLFTIALKMLGSITLPRMKRVEPHPFDSQLTESVRFLFNPNYISQYDQKNTAYLRDPVANPFTEYTFTSSQFWGLDKTLTSDTTGINGINNYGNIDSHPDLLGLGDISSTSPQNNEIPFIEISQWDITEGMKDENQGKVKNLKGSVGLINFNDYVGSEVVPPLMRDKGSGILVGDGTVTNKGFLSESTYSLPDTDTLFTSLREVCSRQITPTQKGTSAGGKYFTKGIIPGIKPLSVVLRNI